jgi:uncharacterized protein DUF4277
MPNPPTYRRPVLEPRGLIAGMFDARGMGEVIDHATRQHPAMRDLTVGEAVNARGLKGLGCLTQARDRGPSCFQHPPPYRRMSPRVPPAQRHDEALGRTLETLDGDGVTARDRRLAVRAATRLGRCPTATPRDTTSVHGDGRDHSAAEPEAQVVPSTTGERGAPRPDLHHGRVALRGEPQAGIPRLLTPRRGHRRAPHTVGPVRRAPGEHGPMTSGATSAVADSARSRADPLDQLAHTAITGRPRVPAPWSAAQAALVHAEPPAMAALHAGDRAHAWTATAGGVEPRGVRLEAALRQAPAQRTVDPPRRQPRDTAGHTCQP